MSEISLSVDAVSELIEEIKVLRTENVRLREAVEAIANADQSTWEPEYRSAEEFRIWAKNVARAALNPPAQTGGSQ